MVLNSSPDTEVDETITVNNDFDINTFQISPRGDFHHATDKMEPHHGVNSQLPNQKDKRIGRLRT